MSKRVILIVLDSAGIGEMPDAAEFGDKGCNTIGHIWQRRPMNIPNAPVWTGEHSGQPGDALGGTGGGGLRKVRRNHPCQGHYLRALGDRRTGTDPSF